MCNKSRSLIHCVPTPVRYFPFQSLLGAEPSTQKQEAEAFPVELEKTAQNSNDIICSEANYSRDKINCSHTMCVVNTHSTDVKIWGGDRETKAEENYLFQPFTVP